MQLRIVSALSPSPQLETASDLGAAMPDLHISVGLRGLLLRSYSLRVVKAAQEPPLHRPENRNACEPSAAVETIGGIESTCCKRRQVESLGCVNMKEYNTLEYE